MSAEATLVRVVGALGRAGIPSMLTGSLAAAIHGYPRATQDIDVVIEATEAQLQALAVSLADEDVFFDLESAVDACARRSMTNILDNATGWKVDLIFRKARPFSISEFGRRIATTIDDIALDVATPEDLILAKLEWAKLGGSTRQVEDAAHLVKVQPDLDVAHIERWLDELGVREQWQDACRLAGRAID